MSRSIRSRAAREVNSDSDSDSSSCGSDDDDDRVATRPSRPVAGEAQVAVMSSREITQLMAMASLTQDSHAPGYGMHGTPRPINPTSEYLKQVAVPSQEQSSDHPLVVISLEGVLCCHVPPHLSGGHTDVLSRPYLDTFINYLLHPDNRWTIAFWSGSMTRKEAMRVLRWLKLPTGSAETDERYLFMLIACLEDLTSESNFAAHAHDLEWATEAFWVGTSQAQVQARDYYCHQALRVCSKQHIVIKATGGN
ncbi:hypothetical protein RQP46_007825 [Phenoliferia psychrophenolica]